MYDELHEHQQKYNQEAIEESKLAMNTTTTNVAAHTNLTFEV